MPAACYIDLLICSVYNRFTCMAGGMCKFTCNAAIKLHTATLIIKHQHDILIQISVNVVTDLEFH